MLILRSLAIIFSLCAIAAPALAISTIPITSTTTKKVWEVPNRSASDILATVTQWSVNVTSSGNAKVTYSDKSLNTLILKGSLPLPRETGFFAKNYINVVHYMLKIETKENKYRTTLTMVKQTLVSDYSVCEKYYETGVDCGDLAKYTNEEDIAKTNKVLNDLLTKLNDFVTTNKAQEDW